MAEFDALFWLLMAWPVGAVALMLSLRSGNNSSAGLPVAYLASLALLHVPGAALYLIPEYHFYDHDAVLNGVQLTTMGMASFVIGVFLGKPRAVRRRASPVATPAAPLLGNVDPTRAAVIFLGLGLVSQLVLLPVLGRVPSVTALLSGMATLSVAGVCLGWHQALKTHSTKLYLLWGGLAALFPVITLTSTAFLGYGVHALLTVLAFLAVHIRLRRLYVVTLALLPMFYIGMSGYVTYMRDRTELREAIWQQDVDYTTRLEKITKMVTTFEFFDVDNKQHLIDVDRRLNQNWLVGAAIDYVGGGNVPFANGETVMSAFIALIPRALWPGKPEFGGSGDMVSDNTGITFAEGTSVGAGQVLELYVNFAEWGVVIGFVVLGALIRQFDARAARALNERDYGKFAIWFVPGLGFLQAGGNMAEVVTSVAAAVGAGYVAAYLVRRSAKKMKARSFAARNQAS
ncbi:MAG TPA: hypothetical protein VLJ58_07865 [Ramlibacter sp.]|nr:hypothetical protein [Ramlibacter sp.]